MKVMRLHIFYCDGDIYPFGKAPCEWYTCIEIDTNYANKLFNSVTKPTARQIRRWKKQAKLCHD
jgi:hypothetical protein